MTKYEATDSEFLDHALTAYFKGGETTQPSMSLSDVYTHAGKKYVLLANCNSALAIYRIKNNGVLKRLKRWYKDLVACVLW